MKLDDVPFIVRDMKKEMPIHTKQSAQVPCSFVRGLPKNLMDWSAHVDNKFLNNHLHEIEEFYHIFPQFHSKQFEKYQLATYGAKYDILNHDGFFRGLGLHEATKHSMMIPSSYVTHPAAGGGCTEGTEMVTGTATTTSNFVDDQLQSWRVSGNNGKCYDQVALDGREAGANPMVLGAYDGSSTVPDSLYAQTDAFNVENAYNYHALQSEITLTSDYTWIAGIHNHPASQTVGKFTVASGLIKYTNTTYTGTLPSTYPSYTDHTSCIAAKIGHS